MGGGHPQPGATRFAQRLRDQLGRYERQQPDNTKRHLGMKTGLQGHVHALPSLRGGSNGWAGESDVHGMVDKEVVRALLERQDIDGCGRFLERQDIDGLLLSWSLAL